MSVHEVSSGVPIYCPHAGCSWSFDRQGKRGQGFLEVHLRVVHKDEDPRNRSEPEPLAMLDGTDGASPGPEATEPGSGSDHQSQEDTRMDALSREQTLADFRRYHEEHGRWPLPADAKETDYLPSKDRVARLDGGWAGLWVELGAGKMPRGRAAGNYRAGKTAVARTKAKRPAATRTSEPRTRAPRPAVEAAGPGLTFDHLASGIDSLRTEEQRLGALIDATSLKRDALRDIIQTLEEAA